MLLTLLGIAGIDLGPTRSTKLVTVASIFEKHGVRTGTSEESNYLAKITISLAKANTFARLIATRRTSLNVMDEIPLLFHFNPTSSYPESYEPYFEIDAQGRGHLFLEGLPNAVEEIAKLDRGSLTRGQLDAMDSIPQLAFQIAQLEKQVTQDYEAVNKRISDNQSSFQFNLRISYALLGVLVAVGAVNTWWAKKESRPASRSSK